MLVVWRGQRVNALVIFKKGVGFWLFGPREWARVVFALDLACENNKDPFGCFNKSKGLIL